MFGVVKNVFLTIALVGIMPAPGWSDVVDDFEAYALGDWPAPWIGYGGNDSDHSVNKVVLDPDNAGNQVLQLYGRVNGNWAAGAVQAHDFGDSFLFEARIRPGTEVLTSEHTERALLSMYDTSNWNTSNSLRHLIQFNANGNIYGTSGQAGVWGSEIGTYTTGQWYDVKVAYALDDHDLHVAYWVDGASLGSDHFTLSDAALSKELTLAYAALEAGGGTSHFDDVRVTVPEPSTVTMFLTLGLIGGFVTWYKRKKGQSGGNADESSQS